MAGVFVMAAALRLLFLLVAAPAFDTDYVSLSSSLLHDGTFSVGGLPTTQFEPLYPLFLAAARLVTGDRTILVRVVQVAVAAAGVVLAYLLAEALTGRRKVAWTCAALHACYPLLIWHAVAAEDSILTSTWLIAAAYTAVTATTAARASLVGWWIGLAILTRAACAPLMVLWPLILAGERRYAQAVACLGAALIVVLPFAVRNYRLAGTAFPTRSGVNLYVGNSRYADSLLPAHSPDNLLPVVDVMMDRAAAGLPPGPRSEAAVDRAMTRAALDEMRARPLATLRLKARYVIYMFWPWIVPSHVIVGGTHLVISNDGHVAVRDSPSRPRLEALAYAVSYGPVLVAALVGVWNRRRHLRADRMLWAVLVTIVAVHTVYFPATRYTVPMSFVLLFYAAVGITSIADRRAPGSRRAL